MIPRESDYTFDRYLATKKSVDDRALNEYVWQTLAAAWEPVSQDRAAEPHILELGAGIGTMVERLLERRMLRTVRYDAVDSRPENLAAARTRLSNWVALQRGVAIPKPDHLRIWCDGGDRRVDLALIPAHAQDFLAGQAAAAGYDLILAHAFLDLVDVTELAPQLWHALRPDGLLYATINFDGATILEPVIDPALDAAIEQLYHATMDQRKVEGQSAGHSRTGRRLIQQLQAHDFQLLAAGASDWLVYGEDGRYPADEAYFLHFIVHTMYEALRHHPELDAAHFEDWAQTRHQQIEAGSLVYIAHQIDLLARKRAGQPAKAEPAG